MRTVGRTFSFVKMRYLIREVLWYLSTGALLLHYDKPIRHCTDLGASHFQITYLSNRLHVPVVNNVN